MRQGNAVTGRETIGLDEGWGVPAPPPEAAAPAPEERKGPPPARRASAAAAFHGDLKTLAGHVTLNTLGNLVTLGLYRFWARTRLRTYFVNNISLAGYPVEYLGRGTELFGAFLIAAFLVSAGVGILTLLVLQDTGAAGGLSGYQMMLGVAFVLLIPIAHYRARYYRLSRISWRGLSLAQDGAALIYAVRAWVMWLAVILSLGVFYPQMRVALARYRWTHTLYGAARFHFEAEAKPLVGPWLGAMAVILPAVLVMLTAILAFAWEAASKTTALTITPMVRELIDLRFGLAALAFGAAWLALMAYIRYRVFEFRYFLSVLSVGSARFESRLPAGPVMAAWSTFALVMFIYFGLISLLAAFTQPLLAAPTAEILKVGGWSLVAIMAAVLFASLGIAFVAALTLNLFPRFVVLRHVCTTLTVQGADGLAAIQARRAGDRPDFGEGLADTLGLGRI